MIGERIKKLRQSKGYSISELADLAGISKSYLSYIERDLQNNPSLQVLAKLVIPLETNIEYLLGDGDLTKDDDHPILDDEWRQLIQKAIDEGMKRGDFDHFKDFIRHKKWNKEKEDPESHNEKKANTIILRIDY